MITIDVPTIQNVGDMMQLALQLHNMPIKELAMVTDYSTDTWYAVNKGIRTIPNRCKKVIARKGIMFMLALAFESTGCRIFAYQKTDRNIQSLLTGLEIYDEKAAKFSKALRKALWNKNSRQDLTDEDVKILEAAFKNIVARVCFEFNFLIEVETKFGTNPAIYMQEEKEKPPALTSKRQN